MVKLERQRSAAKTLHNKVKWNNVCLCYSTFNYWRFAL